MDFTNLIHKGIMDDDKWIRQPLSRQIGNIGAEISRLVHRKENNDTDGGFSALERALELIDLTVYGLTKKSESSKMRELLRFREALCDYALDLHIYEVKGDYLVDYCTQLYLSSI